MKLKADSDVPEDEPEEWSPRQKGVSKIMYIEYKGGGLVGSARIGRVTFSKSGKTLYYKDKRFKSLGGRGFKSNYFDVDTGEYYWISGPGKDGEDRLYGERLPVEIDEDVQKEYWTKIRGMNPKT
jgi:hypothetical protein